MSGLHLGAPDPTQHWSSNPNIEAIESTTVSQLQHRPYDPNAAWSRKAFWVAVGGVLLCVLTAMTTSAVWRATGDPGRARDVAVQFIEAARAGDLKTAWDLMCDEEKAQAVRRGPSTQDKNDDGALDRLRESEVEIGPAKEAAGGYTVEVVVHYEGRTETQDLPISRSLLGGYEVCA